MDMGGRSFILRVPLVVSLPEFLDFTLLGKTVLVVNKKFQDFVWTIHSRSASLCGLRKPNPTDHTGDGL